MKLMTEDLLNLSKIAIKAAQEAGRMISDYASQDIKVEHKESGTSLESQVVTEVDLLSQKIILDHIVPTCKIYDLGMLAEESVDDGSRFEKDYFWCIDPLDGTLSFINSQPGYAVSIALVSREGRSLIGVVYDPFTQTLYYAVKGAGAFRNQKPWNWNPTFSEPYKTIDSGGAVMNVCWLLEDNNESSYYLKNPKPKDGGGCLWDYAATACLFEEIGAFVSDAKGNLIDLNRRDSTFMNLKGVLYASNKVIAKKILKAAE